VGRAYKPESESAPSEIKSDSGILSSERSVFSSSGFSSVV
jgi:hypothetical protein